MNDNNMEKLILELKQWAEYPYSSIANRDRYLKRILIRFTPAAVPSKSESGLRDDVISVLAKIPEPLCDARVSAKWICDMLRQILADDYKCHPALPDEIEPKVISISKAVDKFLCWKIPTDFCPDGGISFIPVKGHEPTGTNLLTATQAKEMFEHCFEVSEYEEWLCPECGKKMRVYTDKQAKDLSDCIPPEEIEPLAVLADRKGVNVKIDGPNSHRPRLPGWRYYLDGIAHKVCAWSEAGVERTYAAAENKCRAYLQSFPNVKEGK